ncbi:hypothetical protein CPC08DRAFT_727126 [Agrocybe pediades]|nr:hypothetical protein CPC08DRAFT_727126 [Agrocybe pediades]
MCYSAWLYAIQEAFLARGCSYSVGPNPELCALFCQLAWLSRSGINAVFLFDGPKRPKVKHGKHASGKAEAELAYLNICGAIDFVVTSDSDVFVFGACNVIRTGTGTPSHRVKETGKDDLDMVTIYQTADGGAGLREPGQFSQAQFLVIAVLVGGDYDRVGVCGCGRSAAEKIITHHPNLCNELFDTGKNSHGQALWDFLYGWCSRLQDILKHGHGIGRKYRKAASCLPDIFPEPIVLQLYSSLITSQSTGGPGSIAYEWLEHKLPNTGALAILCEKKFAKHASSEPESHQAAALIRHVWKAQHKQTSRTVFCSLQHTVSTLMLMQQASDAIIAENNPSPLHGAKSSSYEMLAWVPEPFVWGVSLNMIQEFFGANKKLRHLLWPRSLYKPCLDDSIEIMLPDNDNEESDERLEVPSLDQLLPLP